MSEKAKRLSTSTMIFLLFGTLFWSSFFAFHPRYAQFAREARASDAKAVLNLTARNLADQPGLSPKDALAKSMAHVFADRTSLHTRYYVFGFSCPHDNDPESVSSQIAAFHAGNKGRVVDFESKVASVLSMYPCSKASRLFAIGDIGYGTLDVWSIAMGEKPVHHLPDGTLRSVGKARAYKAGVYLLGFFLVYGAWIFLRWKMLTPRKWPISIGSRLVFFLGGCLIFRLVFDGIQKITNSVG